MTHDANKQVFIHEWKPATRRDVQHLIILYHQLSADNEIIADKWSFEVLLSFPPT